MTTFKRTCSSCAAFNPAREGDDPTCWNLVSITEQALTREPGPGDTCDSHSTSAEDAAETDRISVARQIAESTPEFLEAMHACLSLKDSLGLEHPETQKALLLAMSLAPNSLHEFAAAQAQELGLMPEADGYTDDGEPVFGLDSIAAKLGIGMDEAQAAMEAMLTERAALGLPVVLIEPSKIHRKQ